MGPDNGSYMVAAYVAAALIYLGYGLSLRWRIRAARERRRVGRGGAEPSLP